MKSQPDRNLISRWIDSSSAVGGIVAACCLMFLALIITYEVFMRYFFSSPTAWVQEFSVYLWMAIAFLAAAYALRNDSHFAVTILVDRLSEENSRRLKMLTHMIGLGYSIIFVIKGIEMVHFNYEMGDVSTGLIQVPLWIPGSLLPIGAALLSLQFFNKLLQEIVNKEGR
ncbi:TRAP transporter small permease [Halomonas eurihalina]|uniref:TRAP transporter small permease protein n=1 Tax=Halomonas eurihalina TaxID=42566 RepID=A0A5D9D5W9_HALER|nr:TRAP transporter small permease [Halomonas eurihalina]MDR5858821.1 TRAP transporter small permease [Halomonas eurihalina]TZG38959.1 TRAP transporter small permease [Halomonas eurihalina]